MELFEQRVIHYPVNCFYCLRSLGTEMLKPIETAKIFYGSRTLCPKRTLRPIIEKKCMNRPSDPSKKSAFFKDQWHVAPLHLAFVFDALNVCGRGRSRLVPYDIFYFHNFWTISIIGCNVRFGCNFLRRNDRTPFLVGAFCSKRTEYSRNSRVRVSQ